MGFWNTVHLFDYENFKSNIHDDFSVNKEECLRICKDFLRLTPFLDSQGSLPLEVKLGKVESIYGKFSIEASKFDQDFEFEMLKGVVGEGLRMQYISENFDHQFARFFNFLLFYKYSNYLPYAIGGKYGFSSSLNGVSSLGREIVAKLEDGFGRNYFSYELMGVVGWLTTEEVSLLYLDLEKVDTTNNTRLLALASIVNLAHNSKLGIFMGVDMHDEAVYSTLPMRKLMNYSSLSENDQLGLIF